MASYAASLRLLGVDPASIPWRKVGPEEPSAYLAAVLSSQPCLKELLIADATIERLGFAPFQIDTSPIVVGLYENTLQGWSVNTGKALFVLRHQEVLAEFRFRPGQPRQLYTVSKKGTVSLWKLPDDDAELRVSWTDDKPSQQLASMQTTNNYSTDWTPDGSSIVLGMSKLDSSKFSTKVFVWTFKDHLGAEPKTSTMDVGNDSQLLTAMAMHPAKAMVAMTLSKGEEKTAASVQFLDVAQGKWLSPLEIEDTSYRIAFNRDGNALLVGSERRSVECWSNPMESPVRRWRVRNLAVELADVRFSDDDTKVIIRTIDNQALVLYASNGGSVPAGSVDANLLYQDPHWLTADGRYSLVWNPGSNGRVIRVLDAAGQRPHLVQSAGRRGPGACGVFPGQQTVLGCRNRRRLHRVRHR